MKGEQKPEQEKIEAKTEQKPEESRMAELENQLKRVQAEFENYKKRTMKEKEEISQRTTAGVLKKLLEFVDELELATLHSRSKKDEHLKGMEMLYANMMALLKSEGVEEMKEVQKFDPYKHEAIKYEENEKPEGTIITVLKRGYYLKGEVLRHAMVVVSKGKAKGE